MGNSEVGHTNLGAGFIVYQTISRIDKSLLDGSFAANPHLLAAIDDCIERQSTLHLMGLVSDGGVHSHTRHLVGIVQCAAARGLERVAIHAFTDGRDTGPTTAADFIEGLESELRSIGVGRIVSLSGRYYAMDRDHRWERTSLAYQTIVHGSGPQAATAAEAIANAYAAGTTDEFIVPTVILDDEETAQTVRDDDVVLSFNFRSDRMRQIISALARPEFADFDRGDAPEDLRVFTMTRYEADLPVEVIFEPNDVTFPLARVISEAGLAQFHAAETEKYPHVTFFLNGGREEPFAGEVRAMVPSPKVATYDLKPEMSAIALCEVVIEAIESGRYDFIVVNFANGDMVGHTGDFQATVRAIETVDSCLARVLDAILRVGGRAIVTADHGNAEEMIDRSNGGPMTAHTTNPVPLILVSNPQDPVRHASLRTDGVLSAVAPTLLKLLGIEKPDVMNEASLVRST
jgi:2,3-bisphosphoglycerate-independent phosphoglycerate mutase